MVVVRCVLCVVCSLLYVGCCLLRCCVVCAVFVVLLVARWLMDVVCRVWFVGGCWLFKACCCLLCDAYACRRLFVV